MCPADLTHTDEQSRHPVLFVGAGPGDPDLITVKGQQALMAADTVIYAGSLVPEALLKWTKPEADAINSASLHLDEIVDAIEQAFAAGKRVVRLHTGDPSLYGAIYEQMAALDRKSIPYQVIPGVTAAFAAAAALGIEYTLPEVSQTLILTRMAGRTPVPELESLESLAQHQATMAIYLSIALVERVGAILSAAYGPDAICAVCYRVSQPGQQILYTTAGKLAATVKSHDITRQALIIAGKVLDIKTSAMTAQSRLYDRHFAHGFRKADIKDADAPTK